MICCFSDGTNPLASDIHVATGVGSADRSLWPKLGLLDPPHRNSNLHEPRHEIRHQIGWFAHKTTNSQYVIALFVCLLQNGLLSAAPYFALFVLGFVFSPVTDLLITRKIVSLTIARKIMNSIGKLYLTPQIHSFNTCIFRHFDSGDHFGGTSVCGGRPERACNRPTCGGCWL